MAAQRLELRRTEVTEVTAEPQPPPPQVQDPAPGFSEARTARARLRPGDRPVTHPPLLAR
ncbi:hypothetical protein [Kocuria sp. U4B]